MTDREIMLSAEQRIDELMNKMLGSDPVSKKQVLQELKAVKESVHQVTTSTIDYQIVVDNLDDNILIADASETILYVNKAYQKSSGIPKENLIGKTVSHIAETTDYFTVTTVPDVIQKKEPVMKLSYLPGQKNPSIVVGMPIFYSNGELQYIIATNRELSTYTNLRDNYNTFLNLLSDMKSAKNAVQVIQETFTLSEKQMIGEGKEMTQIRKFISNVASTDATVLVTGESGTVKSSSPMQSIPQANEITCLLSRSTVLPFRHSFWNPNCSVMKKVLFQVQMHRVKKVCLKQPTKVRFCWMRLAICRWSCRQNCCVPSRAMRSPA